MGERVLHVGGSLAKGREARVWAHCTPQRGRRQRGGGAGAEGRGGGEGGGGGQTAYPAGAVTLLVLNTNNASSASVTPMDAATGMSLLVGGWDE
jgi:hypothetical protein